MRTRVFLTIFSFSICFLFLSSCSTEDGPADDLFISEEERALMDDCRENLFTTGEDIRSNLIGDWKIIGYGCGFCAPHNPPNMEITFEESSGEFEFVSENDQQQFSFTWNIQLSTSPGTSGFLLSTTPDHFSLSFDNFCPDFMYFDHTSFDGLMILMKKD